MIKRALLITAVLLFAQPAYSAEFLVRAFDTSDSFIGDIVEVRVDGALYGRKERDPTKYSIVKVPGLPFQANRFFQNPERSGDGKGSTQIHARSYTVGALSNLAPYYTGEENFYEMSVGQWNSLVEKK